MSSDNEGTAPAVEEVVVAAEEEGAVQSVQEEDSGDSGSTQDANDESRSLPQVVDSLQTEEEGDSNGQQEQEREQEQEQEQQQEGHDNHAGEEEDGGVKVHHEDDEEGEGEGADGDGNGDQNGHVGGVEGISEKGCGGEQPHPPPPPPSTEGTEEVEEEELVEVERDNEDEDGEEEEEDEDDEDEVDGQSDSDEEIEGDEQDKEEEKKEVASSREVDVVQAEEDLNLQPNDAEDDTQQHFPVDEEVIITPDTAAGAIEPSQDDVENCTEAVKDPSSHPSHPPSRSGSPPPQVEVEAPSPNDTPESTELLPEGQPSTPSSDSPSADDGKDDEDNKTDDNTGRDEAPDPPSETAGEENNPNPADTSAEDSAASAAPVSAHDSIDPIIEYQEQNANPGEEQEKEERDQEGEKVLVQDRDQEKTFSTDFAEQPLDSAHQLRRDNNNNIIITVIYDINEPLPLPPAGYQTAITHPDPPPPVAEQNEQVGTEIVEEPEDIDTAPTADSVDDEPQHFPVLEPQQEAANPNDSSKTDNEELPGEVEPPPTAAEEASSVEVPPPAYTPTEPEKDPQDPIVAAPLIMSEVSALSNGTGSYKDATPPTLQQPFMQNPFETSFAAGPLDDDAAAAVGAAALAMSAVGVPDGSRRPKKDKSHRKKDRSSGDGTEKERKHRDKGDRGDRERAKSRERGEKGKRDKSELGIGERRAKSRDRLRDDGKSRDRDPREKEKEKKHRTPEEKAEREARKAAKKGLAAPTPVYEDIAVPYDQYDQQYDQQYEEDRRRQKKASRRNGIVAGEFVEPQILGGMEMPYEEERKEKKKSKKSRPPPIDIESTQQHYELHQEDQLKRRKSSKKAAAILGEPVVMNEPPMSPYIDGPIEQPKRKKSSKRSPPPDIGAEPVQVLHEPDARPPPAGTNRRSRSDSLKNPIPGGSAGSGEKKHSHKKKDSAHLTPEEREKRRRKHEDDKALREGRELENHLYNGSKEKRKLERALQKAAKAKAEELEGIPPPLATPRFTDELNLPIQNPDNQPEISPSVYGGDQYLQGQPHRDQQDLNAPNPEAPFSPRSFAASDDQAKADKAARRAERRARKEREARQTDGENLDHPKDSGHSLSSEGKREREHHHKSRDKVDRTRSRSRPAGPEDEEERRRRKEERREARRLAALNGNEVRDVKEKKSKHREGGRVRSNSERSREKDMMREMEVGYPEGYGNASQQPWQAGNMTDGEDGKVGLMRRTFSKFLKF